MKNTFQYQATIYNELPDNTEKKKKKLETNINKAK